MATISREFAKVIVKNYKMNFWQQQYNAGFEDTAYVEFSKANFQNILNNLGSDTQKVRIYFAKYPINENSLKTIAENPKNFKQLDRFSQADVANATTEYAFVKDPKNKYENHTSLVFVGVSGDGKEIFEENRESKVFAITSAQNHGDLRPPYPPSELPVNPDTLYDDCYVP